MKRIGFPLAAGAAALLAGCGVGAPDYPEFLEASYRIEGVTADINGGGTTSTIIYRDGPRMRVEATIPQYGQAAVVFDQSTNAAYVLTSAGAIAGTRQTLAPGQAPAPGATPAQPGAAPPATAGVQAAPTAVGVAVKLNDADAPQPMETAWSALGEDNARSLGDCEVAGEAGHQWTPRDASAGVERVACITDDGIVLRITENGAALWQATSLQRGAQDTSLFGVPQGYQIIDPQAVAESVGENMERLDSVTGAPNTPQPAPTPPG